MNRQVAAIAAAVFVAIVAAGAVVLANGDGPYAIKIGGRAITQESVDKELKALAENAKLQDLIAQSGSQPLSISDGSVTTGVAAGWLGLRVGQELAARRLERRGLEISPDDRDNGRALAEESLGGAAVLSDMPASFRRAVVKRYSIVAVFQRELVEEPTPAMLEAARRVCTPGRYVAHILVGSLLEAQAIKRELDSGDDFAELARTSSIDTASADNGGRYGCLSAEQFGAPFQTVAETTALDVPTDPVQTEFGFHIILVTEKPPADVLGAAALDEIFGRARGADVEVDPRYGRWDARNGQILPPRSPAPTAPTP